MKGVKLKSRELAVNNFRQNLTLSLCLTYFVSHGGGSHIDQHFFSPFMIMQLIHSWNASECYVEVNGQCHTLSLSLLDCKLWALVLCLCPCLLPRPESGESISFCQAVPVGASISARPERLDLHWSFRGVSASADSPGHSTHLPAQHSHRGQTCYQPEKLRYLH